LSTLRRARRHQAGAHDGRFAGAGRAHDGDEATAAHLFDQRHHEGFTTDEEGGVLLAKGKEAAIGTDRSAQIGGERRLVARRQAACGPHQDLDGHSVCGALPQIDPSVEAEKSECRINGSGEQHRDHRKAGLVCLSVERLVMLTLLPRPHARCANADGDGAAVAEVLFQGLGPRLTSNEVPAVDKDCEATVAKGLAEPLHRILVGATVA
jgi:hypothetical protein